MSSVRIGTWITLGNASIAEILLRAGFDWLTIDLEHSAITFGEAQRMIQVIDLGGGTPYVRVGSHDPTEIKRVLDAGAHGVIVPMIQNREQAEKAVAAVKYPPQGTRGVGLGRAQGYGTSFKKYQEWAASSSKVYFQIEHVDAIENLESILTVKGCDGVFIGPYDLSASLGFPGEFDHPEVKKAIERFHKVTANKKVEKGIHVIEPNPAEVQKRIAEGFNFIAYCLDTLFLARMCERGLGEIRG